MPTSKLREFLDSQNVNYTVVEHSEAYTAQEVAASAHIPGKQVAKTVMVVLDDKMAMAVLPAPHRVDFDRLKEATGAGRVRLASEQEFKDLFPDCDVGAMPPFGNLYGLEVIVDGALSGEIEIGFCAGTHTELIRMSYKDFERLAEPKVLDFSVAD